MFLRHFISVTSSYFCFSNDTPQVSDPKIIKGATTLAHYSLFTWNFALRAVHTFGHSYKIFTPLHTHIFASPCGLPSFLMELLNSLKNLYPCPTPHQSNTNTFSPHQHELVFIPTYSHFHLPHALQNSFTEPKGCWDGIVFTSLCHRLTRKIRNVIVTFTMPVHISKRIKPTLRKKCCENWLC